MAQAAPLPPSPTAAAPDWLPWVVMGCSAGIVTSAVVANYRDNRPLTTEEAWSCGVRYWFATPRTGTVKVARKSKKKV